MATIFNKNKNTAAAVPEGTYGPHSSRLANAADPRVDSDLDGNPMSGAYAGNDNYTTAAGTTAGGVGSGPAPTTAGPHQSDILNKLDPRFDSKTGVPTGAGAGTTATAAGAPAAAGVGHHHHHHTAGNTVVGPAGTTTKTHEVAGSNHPLHHAHAHPNAVRDAEYAAAGAGIGAGVGALHHHHNKKHHPETAVAGGAGGAGATGLSRADLPGPAPNTAGPHRSDILNKLDPRFDSKTGLPTNGNTTSTTTTTTGGPVMDTGTTTGGRGLVGGQTAYAP